MLRVRFSVAFFALAASVLAWPAGGFGSPAKVAAADPRAWPTAYEPAALSAADLLLAAKRARGNTRDDDTRRVTYDYVSGGLSGTERDVYRGDDYRSDNAFGPFTTAEGRYKGQLWEIGENGYALLKRGIHQRGEANSRALEVVDPGENVAVLGRLRSPADVYVLRVAPKDGRDELRFYDATTYHLMRIETEYLGRLIVRSYADYRPAGAGGGVEAYRITYSDGRPANDEVLTVRDVAAGVPVSDAELAIPGGRRQLVEFPSGVDRVRLPARIDRWGRIIVRLDIDGRGFDFQLDSGASEIVIDRDAAAQLGLKVYGNWSQTVAGTVATSEAVIPRINVGTLSMNDVAVKVLPFGDENDESTRVVGLLGFDFIAGGVIKIDYEHGTVDAMRYDAEIPKSAIVVDAILDDNVPVISATVNGKAGDHFILDTGSDDIVLFSSFVKRFGGTIKDHSPGGAISREFNLSWGEGVGGDLHTHTLALERLTIGPVAFTDFVSQVLDGDQPSFEGEDTDGLVGASVLSAFDVYLDYANSRVAFVLNGTAKNHRASRGLGSELAP